MKFLDLFRGNKGLRGYKFYLDKVCYLCGKREYNLSIKLVQPVDTIQIYLDLKGE